MAEDLDCDPFFTRDRAWDDKHVPRTRKFKKTFTSGKRVEEEVVIDNGTYDLEYAVDKNIHSFNEALTTLQYG